MKTKTLQLNGTTWLNLMNLVLSKGSKIPPKIFTL